MHSIMLEREEVLFIQIMDFRDNLEIMRKIWSKEVRIAKKYYLRVVTLHHRNNIKSRDNYFNQPRLVRFKHHNRRQHWKLSHNSI